MKRLILLLLLAAQTAFGAESVMVDSATRNVINTGVVNFAPEQLKVDGISVIGGAGGSGPPGTGLPSMPGHNGQFLQTDGTVALWATVSFASLSGKPTTLGGYGITDAVSLTNFTWVNLGGKPTTLAGFGITDAQPLDADLTVIAALATQSFGRGALTMADAAGFRTYIGAGTSNFDGTFTSLTSKPTTLGGYGITDAQPLDPDLTSLAAATGTNTIYYRSASNNWSAVTIGTNISFVGGVLSGPTGLGTGDVSSNLPNPSPTPGEAVVFADNTGKLITHATGTGIATLASGVLGSTSTIGPTQGGTGQSAVATGDILYGSNTNIWSRLAGSTATTPVRYLRSVGTGSTATAPTWTQPAFSELSGIPTTLAGYGITDALANDSTPFSEIVTAGTASTARSNLGLTIGTNIQAWDTDLDALAAFPSLAATGGSGTSIAVPYRKTSGPPSTWGTITLGTGLSFDAATGILTGTTPGGSGDVISNVTGNITGQVAIYDINNDGKHIKPASGSGIAKLGPSAGVLGVANANTEYGVASEATFATAGISGTPLAWTAGKVVMNEGTALTAIDGYSTLPAANTFAPGTIITYIDNKTITNFGRNFHPIGTTDTLDGQTSVAMGATWLRPFIAGGLTAGQGVYQFKTDGTGAWVSVYADGRATKIQDPSDARKQVFFDASNQPNDGTTHYTVRFPQGNDSAAVSPLSQTAGVFLNGMTSTGEWLSSPVYQKDILSNQDDITIVTGPPNSSTGNPHLVPNTGLIDNIRLSADLTATGPLTIVLPNTAFYKSGQAVFFYDASGTLNTTNTVTLIPSGGDTVNHGGSVVLNRDHESRRMIVSIPVGSNPGDWTVESYGGSIGNGLNIGPYVALTDAAAITATCNQNLIEQNWTLTGTSGIGATRTITIANPRQGEKFRLVYTHYSTNDTVVLQSAATPGNGLGLLNLSKAIGAVDVITGSVRNDGKLLIDSPSLNLTFTAAITYSTVADSGPANAGAVDIGIAAPVSGFGVFQAGQFVASSTYNLGRIDLNLKKVGTPVGGIVVAIADDDIRATDAAVQTVSGSNIIQNVTAQATTDVGQRVTGAGIPNPSYISAVDTILHTITLVNSKGGSTASNATANANPTTINIWGKVGAALSTGVSNAVSVSGIPTAYNITVGTTSDYTQFTGFNTTVTNGKTYWIVATADTPLNDNANYVHWRAAFANTGYIIRNGATFSTITVPGSNSTKPNFITYKP